MNLSARLQRHGLFLRGVTRLDACETERYGLPADKPQLALVGNIGSSYWPDFSAADEYRDGLADPLDRWSMRIAESIAAELPVMPVYPFDGPPYYPFQQWAERAEGLARSPLGITIHPEHGLWHSYRFALLGNGFDAGAAREAVESPCLTCRGQPCLHACPVTAFDGRAYDVGRCTAYLRREADAACHGQGCLAPLACPVAPGLRYVAAQGSFHLRAFMHAHA